MKKIVLISIFFLSLFFQSNVQAQVPNGGFESWTSSAYKDPSGWFTGNRQTLSRMGVAPVTRVTGFAGYAVRLQTTIAGSDTSESYITNSYGDPLNGEGGVPFSEQPIGIKAKYRCNLPGNDSAIILVVFKNSGTIISANVFKVGGVESTFINFSFDLTVPVAPDSVIVAIASSDLITRTGIRNGSYIEVDNLVFTGATQVVPNYDFEAWDSLQFDRPNGWYLNGDSIFKTTDSYSGTYAARMKTQDYGGGNINSATISTGYYTQSGPGGGYPYSNNIDTLCGYYKYITTGTDSGISSVQLTNMGTVVGGNGMFFPPAASYTYFQMPLFAGATPDTMRVDFSSSKWPYSSESVGSTLFLDRIALKSVLLSVANIDHSASNIISSFPNPAKDELTFNFSKKPTADFDIMVYNMLGGLVKNERYNCNAENYKLRIGDLSSGTYYYKCITKDGQYQNSFVKE